MLILFGFNSVQEMSQIYFILNVYFMHFQTAIFILVKMTHLLNYVVTKHQIGQNAMQNYRPAASDTSEL